MQFIRRSTLGLCISLLFSVLLLFGIAFGLFKLFGSPEPMKHALRESGLYQSIVGDALAQAQKEQQKKEGGQENIPLDRPEIQNLIQTAASPQVLQTQTEGALDAVYAWAQGKTQKLEFVVDLGEVKNNLANGIEQYVKQHVAALPVCARGDSGNIDDPFNATCRPQGANADQVAAQAKAELLNGEFLKETKIDAASLKGEDGKTIEQRFSAVPETYQKVKWSVYGLGVLAVLLVVAVIFLSIHWRAGMKKVGVIFVVIGATGIFFSWLAGMGMQRAGEFATEPLQKTGVAVAKVLASDLRSWWLLYGLVLALTGLAILITLRLTRKKLEQQIAQEATAEPTPEQTAAESPKAKAPKTTKPPRKLVQ